jgi:hypothetical protein
MAAPTQVVEGLWQIGLGAVNAFLIEDGELTLIDTGLPKSDDKIVAAIESTGKKRHRPQAHCRHTLPSGSRGKRRRPQAQKRGTRLYASSRCGDGEEG